MKITDQIVNALKSRIPVVALESSVISQGMAYPKNLEIALAMEKVIRGENAEPATLAIIKGEIKVGCNSEEINFLSKDQNVIKAGSREIGFAVATNKTAALTVSGSIVVANKAGIQVFATGGIGGVHPSIQGNPFDVSSDLFELSRNPVVVVCAGAKSILDLKTTLELLETLSVPVFGYQTKEFPAFFTKSSELNIPEVSSPDQVALIARKHWEISSSAILLCLPVQEEFEISANEIKIALKIASEAMAKNNISGQNTTPFLLKILAEITQGKTVIANEKLLIANGILAARVATSLLKFSS